MADPTQASAPPRKRRLRLGRILTVLLLLGGTAAGAYGASWLNSQRFYLIVEQTEVRIGKGRMFPVGHEAYRPANPALRGAYGSFPLPGGMTVPREERRFSERTDLDQALFRLLTEATQFTLTVDNERTPELAARYLAQLKSIPGLTTQQQVVLTKLERDASYVRARGLTQRAQRLLKDALKLFEESGRGGGGERFRDGEDKGYRLKQALRALTEPSRAPQLVKERESAVPSHKGITETTTTSSASP